MSPLLQLNELGLALQHERMLVSKHTFEDADLLLQEVRVCLLHALVLAQAGLGSTSETGKLTAQPSELTAKPCELSLLWLRGARSPSSFGVGPRS
eukprot:5088320-Heterocapsa_arctica.AAC.1